MTDLLDVPAVPPVPKPVLSIDPQLVPYLLAGAVLLFVYYRPPGGAPTPDPAPVPQPAPVVPYAPPPPTDPLGRLLVGRPDEALELAEFFKVAAEFAPSTSLASTGALRDAYAQAGRTAFAGWQGRIPGLAAAIDAELQTALGLEDRPLDPAVRAAAAQAFAGIAERLRAVR